METDEFFMCPLLIPYWIKKDKCDTDQLFMYDENDPPWQLNKRVPQ